MYGDDETHRPNHATARLYTHAHTGGTQHGPGSIRRGAAPVGGGRGRGAGASVGAAEGIWVRLPFFLSVVGKV